MFLDPAVAQLQRRVETLVLKTGRLEAAEAVINSSAFDEDAKAGLWLWAWAHLPVHRQRALVAAYFEQILAA